MDWNHNSAVRTLTRPEASPQSEAFSITNGVKCLESIEVVDGSPYIKAVKMFEDVDWREMFMAMYAQRKLVWLASLELMLLVPHIEFVCFCLFVKERFFVRVIPDRSFAHSWQKMLLANIYCSYHITHCTALFET